MVWSLALCPDDAKQDPVVYGAEFGVVLLAEGPRTASIQEGLNCLGLYHSNLEEEHYFRKKKKHPGGKSPRGIFRKAHANARTFPIFIQFLCNNTSKNNRFFLKQPTY